MRFLQTDRRPAGLRGTDGNDDGFTIIEVTVAFVIFALVASSAIGLIIRSLAASADSRRRIAATSLATREIEIARGQFNSATLGPRTVLAGRLVNANPLSGAAGTPLVLDGTSYTVTRTAEWQSLGAAAGACDGGATGQLAFLRVSVAVTWPNMRATQPVVSTTLLTPRAGTYSSGTGHAVVKVSDAAGRPAAGQVISLSGPAGSVSQTTAEDGCGFFAYLTPGTYTATIARSGYVDLGWNSTTTGTTTVTAGSAAPTLALSYDAATNLTASASAPAGYAVPPETSYTVYNTAITSAYRTRALPSLGAASTASVWPYSDGVTAWAGSCLDADPASYSGGSRGAVVTTAPGGTGSATVALQPVNLRLTKAGVGVSSAQIYAVHAVDASCATPVTDPTGGTAGQVLTPPVSDASGTSKVALPAGTWSFKVRYQAVGARTPTTYTVTTASPIRLGTSPTPTYTIAIP